MADESPILKENAHDGAHKTKGLALVGVQRAKSWRGRHAATDSAEAFVHVRYRDLEALVLTVAFELPDYQIEAVQLHQRFVETAMRRGSIVPAPYGLIFHGRRPLIKLMQDQYLMLDEALSFLNGQCEVRMHLTPLEGAEPDDELLHAATQVYSDLRRMARAAVPFPREGRKLMGAAFLVDKTGWVEFIQRAEDLAASQGDLTVDITGPWPPYDFVRFVV